MALSPDAPRIRQRMAEDARQQIKSLNSEIENYRECFKIHDRRAIKDAIAALEKVERLLSK